MVFFADIRYTHISKLNFEDTDIHTHYFAEKTEVSLLHREAESGQIERSRQQVVVLCLGLTADTLDTYT